MAIKSSKANWLQSRLSTTLSLPLSFDSLNLTPKRAEGSDCVCEAKMAAVASCLVLPYRPKALSQVASSARCCNGVLPHRLWLIKTLAFSTNLSSIAFPNGNNLLPYVLCVFSIYFDCSLANRLWFEYQEELQLRHWRSRSHCGGQLSARWR